MAKHILLVSHHLGFPEHLRWAFERSTVVGLVRGGRSDLDLEISAHAMISWCAKGRFLEASKGLKRTVLVTETGLIQGGEWHSAPR